VTEFERLKRLAPAGPTLRRVFQAHTL
jgi:hypothetical protein